MSNLNTYRLPAEWEPHESTWLSWVHNADTWPYQLKEAQEVYLQFIKSISTGEKVHLLSGNEKTDVLEARLRNEGVNPDQVIVHACKTDDSWIRDCGPDFLLGEQDKVILNWKFNAWGEKYLPYDNDNQIPETIGKYLGLQCYSPDMVLELSLIHI